MSKPVFRNPDKVQVLKQRDFIRDHCLPGTMGLVVEDLDLILRWWGPNFNTDEKGKVRLVELKHGDAPLGTSKKNTFHLIDEGLRSLKERYDGYYVVRTNSDEWEKVNQFDVNRTMLNRKEFLLWLNCELKVEKFFK